MTPFVDPEMSTMLERQTSGLQYLEEIAEQSSRRVNKRAKYKTGWQISPSIERAKASREPKQAKAKPQKRKPNLEPIATCAPATPAVIKSYEDLICAFRARRDELEISLETLDMLAGLPDRLGSKILNLRHIRRLGMATLGPVLDALGLKLIVIVDEEALARNRSRMPRRNKSQVRCRRLIGSGHVCR
jgi:hypothetical protein